jgi:hypothetical protein
VFNADHCVNSTSELDSYTNGIRRSLLSDVIQH